MAIGAFLGALSQGVSQGLGDVEQFQKIHAEGQKQAAQDEMTRYASDAIKNNTDPMDFAQNMYAMSVKAGDQQAASHWYGAYNDQKQIKTNHALIGAYTAADQGDADLASSYFNKYAGYAGLGDKTEVVPHVDPASGQETRTIAMTSPDGRRTVLPPDQWNTIAKARLAIELSNLEAQQKIPYWQQGMAATTGKTKAETVTEGYRPEAVQAQANQANAEAGSTTALIGPRSAQLYGSANASNADATSTRALIGPRTAQGYAAAGEANAQAGYLGEEAKTKSALRAGEVNKQGMDIVEGAARTSAFEEEAQNKRLALPSDIGAKEAETQRNQEYADYLRRGGRQPAPKGPTPWTAEDQKTMQAAISEHTGVGNDPLTGAKVTSGQPSYPELADPNAQRAMTPLTQSLMTAAGNQGTLRNNAAGAAELAAAIIAHKATIVRNRTTGKITANYGGVTYEVPPAALAGANIQAGGPQALGNTGGPPVPMQRQ
jgi:hypothetical protein